ncbi:MULTISPECIES: hypothetical protein [unclassified Kitasatospora]
MSAAIASKLRLLGAALMTGYGLVRPEFLRGETLRKETPALVVERR